MNEKVTYRYATHVESCLFFNTTTPPPPSPVGVLTFSFMFSSGVSRVSREVWEGGGGKGSRIGGSLEKNSIFSTSSPTKNHM